jgi:uncharacterized membrane protein
MLHSDEANAHGAYSAETKLRTFLRSVTWRISGVVLTVVLAIALTGDVKLGVELGVSYNLIRLSTHYFHDRAWARWRWGWEHHEGAPPSTDRPPFLARFFGSDPGEPEVPAPDEEPVAAPGEARA